MMLGDPSSADDRNPRAGRAAGFGDAVFDDGQAAVWADEPQEPAAFDLAVYWRLALKHRILILGCFLGALAIGAALTLLMTPIYTATATLQIDRESARIVNSEDVTPRENMAMGEE